MARVFTKEEAIVCVMSNAKIYKKKLENENMLVIYKVNNTDFSYIEIVFEGNNYQHLTGVELIDEHGNILDLQAENFYRKCLENRLGCEEILLKKDGTTHLKLEALPSIMNVYSVTKITGDHNGKQPLLCFDKTIGNINVCLGIRLGNDGFYHPVSALKKDIKELSNNPLQVIAVFTKSNRDEIFSRIRHVTKGVNIRNLNFSEDILNKINLNDYVPK